MKKTILCLAAALGLFFTGAQAAAYSPSPVGEANGEGEEPVYTIDCSEFSGGKIVADTLLAKAGDVVTFTAIPNTNYYFSGPLTIEMTIDGIDAQGRETLQHRTAVLTTEDIQMTLNPQTGYYSGTFEMLNSNVRVISANFVAKRSQAIKAGDIEVYEDSANVFVEAYNATEGGGALSYAVTSGSDVVEIDPETGELYIKGSGSASVVITAAETETYRKTSVSVTVTVKELPKKNINIVSGMATFYDANYSFVIPEGIQVWTGKVSYDENAVIMTEIFDVIPAGTPVFITSESLASATLVADVHNAYRPIESDLKASDNFYGDVAAAGNIFVLHYGVFIRAAAGTLPTGKAYVEYNTDVNNARLVIIFDTDGETAISSLKSQEKVVSDDEAIYDISGRRLSAKPKTGFYIKGGKKYSAW